MSKRSDSIGITDGKAEINMHTKQMTVTPELAKQFLTQNTNNRSVRRSSVLRMIADMKAGKFILMPHGIVFLEDGTLADGQHRLLAIVECGIPQEMMVTFGAPKDCRLNIDRGVNRTDYDNLNMSGNSWAGLTSVAILKMIVDTGSRRTLTVGQLAEIANKDVVFAIEKSISSISQNKRFLSGAPIRAAVALAVLNMPNICFDRLSHFGDVLATGFGNGDEDSAAILLRNAAMNARGFTKDLASREECLRLAQVCLHAFLNKKPLRRTPKHDDLIWQKIKI